MVGREDGMEWGWDGMDGPVVDVSQSSSRQVEVEMAERQRRGLHTRSIVGARVGIWEKRGPGDPSLPRVKDIKGEMERPRERRKRTSGAKWGFEWVNGSDRSWGCNVSIIVPLPPPPKK